MKSAKFLSRVFSLFLIGFGFFAGLALVVDVGRVSAAADIAINNAKVNGSNTVLVTFDDPGQNIASVDFSKWHIDVGDGGATPLNPASAAVTSAGTPWTVTLTFAAGSFSDTATAYGAAVGLYVDASGVTDTNADTNAVVGHAASIAITDGQAPTFTSASATSNTNIRIVMSETMAGGTVTFGAANQWTATGIVSSGVAINGANIDLTVGALGNTAFTAADFAFATASGVIRDAANNSTVAFNAKAITDGQVPTLVSAQYLDVGGNGAVETIRTTWSEAVTMNGSGAADWTITAGSISAVFSAAGNDAAAGTTLDVTVTADANETSSATAPTIAYDNDDANGSVTDGTNVAGTNAAVTLTDGAGPIIVSASATTPSPNNILVNFSETISRAQLLAGDFTVADDASNDLGTTTVVAVGVDGTGTDAIVVITGPIGFSNVGTDTIRFSAAGVVVDSSAGLNASVQVATVPITISRVQSSGGGSNPPASPPPATPTPPPAATPPPPVVPDVKKEEEKKDEVKKDDIKKDEGKKEEGKKDDKKKEPSKTPFKDIVGHLAEAAIAMLWEQKIVTGKTAVLFKPNDTLLRDEMIKWVVLAFKIDVPKTITQKPFKDVSPKDKYAPYISAAVSKKILTGKRSSELQPKKPVTRGEVLKAILIAAGVNVSKESTSDFKDVPVKNALNPYVAYAVKNGIVEVKGKSFGPNVRVTRAEVVMMIVKALEL